MERQHIADKISQINRSLEVIDYNPGSYITPVSDKTPDAEKEHYSDSAGKSGG